MQFFADHILTITLFWPVAWAVVLLFVPKSQETLIYRVTTYAAFLPGFLLSLPLWFWYGSGSDRAVEYPGGFKFHFVEAVDWIPALKVQYFIGIDGMALLLLLLTTLLGFISSLSSKTAITHRVKEYYIFLLLLQAGMLGVFMALDFFLFYVFWEVMLVPMYFLIGVWGSTNRLYAAIKFFLYTLLGSVLMLLAIIKLYIENGHSFNIVQMYTLNLAPGLQWWIFLAFFVGFAIKVPMFPFHTWLPDAHTEAPTAGSVILAGVLLKMGTYGFVRIAFPIVPEGTQALLPWMLVLSVVGILYGAMVSLVQKDWKRLVAFSSVSHLGFVMLGLFALNPNGISGGILQMVNHGISTGALFLLVGLVYERRHTRMISEYGGIAGVMPVYAALFAVILFSSIGLPGLNGFIGEFTILQGAFQIPAAYGGKTWAILAALGIVLGAAYMLWLYQRTMFGKVTNPANEGLRDVKVFGREFWTLFPLVILAVWIGVYPKPFFEKIEDTVRMTMSRVNPDHELHPSAGAIWEGRALAAAHRPEGAPRGGEEPGAPATEQAAPSGEGAPSETEPMPEGESGVSHGAPAGDAGAPEGAP